MGHDLQFHNWYSCLLANLLACDPEINARTGVAVRTLEGGISVSLDLREDRLPMHFLRVLRPASAAAEVAFFLSGSTSLAVAQHLGCRFWDKFADAAGNVQSYGDRWRRRFGRDQLALAIGALRRDPSDRRVLVSAWDPSTDGLMAPSASVPCPFAFTLGVSRGRLHTSLFVRSSDAFVGLPYDVLGHALLLDLLARELGLPRGVMTVHLANVHLYGVHDGMARECLLFYHSWQRPVELRAPPFPSFSLSEAERVPRLYVNMVRGLDSRHTTRPPHDPRPEVVA